jgi:hypothetical protein
LGSCGLAFADAVAGKKTEPANWAPTVAIAPIKERRSLNPDPDSRFSRFFDVIPAPSCRYYPSRSSITEIAHLSIKITRSPGPVQFVVVDVGVAPRWIPASECFEFWKNEAKPHLAGDTKVDLNEFHGGYCYFASQWEGKRPRRSYCWKKVTDREYECN